MNGIEILNQYEVVATTAWSWSVFWISWIIVMIIFIIVGVIVGIIQKDLIGNCVFGCVMGCIFGGLIGVPFASQAEKTYTTEYQVIISDEVSLTDFYNTYDIIEQEGKIFKIREKKVGEK